MTATTIKVSASTRDRLKAHAAAYGEPLGVHLERLLDLADREARFDAMHTAMAAAPIEVRVAYERERDEWLDARLD